MPISIPLRPVLSHSTDWIPAPISSFPSTPPLEESRIYGGTLLLREEIPIEEATFQHFLSHHYFTPIQAIMQKSSRQQCRRCGNQKKHLFGTLPCARCGEKHLYCRNCIQMGRVLACEPLYYWTGPVYTWPKIKNPCTWKGELSRHQRHASKEIMQTMTSEKEEKLVWAVCGAGKTEMLFEGIAAALEQGKRICLATPRADVVRELLPRFRSAFSSVAVTGLYGGSEAKQPAQLTIATTHQLLRFAHAFDVLIIDEIDAFPYHNDPSLHFAASRAAKPAVSKVYLTATPRKQQQKRIAAGSLSAVFVPVRFHGHPLPVPRLEIVFNLKKILSRHQPPKAFYRWIDNRKNPKRQVLIFVPTIELADQLLPVLKERFQSDKHKHRIIDAVHASDPEREVKVQHFRAKQIDILLTTTILERGVTFPSVDVAVLDAGHAVFDEAALVQIAGRAGRSPDDPTGEVVFYHDGKTDAIVAAIRSIDRMNQRGKKK